MNSSEFMIRFFQKTLIDIEGMHIWYLEMSSVVERGSLLTALLEGSVALASA